MTKYRVNAYLATLIIVCAGSLAAWTIVRVAYNTQYTVERSAVPNTEASYGTLEQSILKSSPSGVPQQ